MAGSLGSCGGWTRGRLAPIGCDGPSADLAGPPQWDAAIARALRACGRLRGRACGAVCMGGAGKRHQSARRQSAPGRPAPKRRGRGPPAGPRPFSRGGGGSTAVEGSRGLERRDWLLKHLATTAPGEEEEEEMMVAGLVDHIQSEKSDYFKPRKDIAAQVQVLRSLGLSLKEMKRLADMRPKLLVSLPARTMQKKFKFFLEVVGLSKEQLRKVILKFPRLLEYSTKKTFVERLAYLESLGIKPQEIPKLICQAPNIIELSVKNTLEPKVKYLLDDLGLPAEAVSRMLVRHPSLLAYRSSTLKTRVTFLQMCGFSMEDIVKIVVSHPQVLHYDIDSMGSRLQYFRRIGVAQDKLPAMLARMPSLLSLDIQMNMVPKFSYLVDELGGDVNSLVQDPVYMGLSLEKRIIPRHQFIELIRPDAARTKFPMNWLKCSDLVFAEKVAKVSLEEFQRFKTEREGRGTEHNVDGDQCRAAEGLPQAVGTEYQAYDVGNPACRHVDQVRGSVHKVSGNARTAGHNGSLANRASSQANSEPIQRVASPV